MNTEMIKAYILKNNPNGVSKLSFESNVSVALIYKIIRDNHKPSVKSAQSIARVLGVSLDVLCSKPKRKAKATN